MKQTGNSAQAARAEMDHAQAELMEILWKKEQAAQKEENQINLSRFSFTRMV